MSSELRSWIKLLPGSKSAITTIRSLRSRARQAIRKRWGMKRVFSDIFARRAWCIDGESISGDGSSLAQTAAIRPAIQELVRELRIRSVLDIPCGDFNWMKEVVFENVSYLGADIVPALIDENTKRYGRQDNRKFLVLNVVDGKLPTVDLILVRDCLVHFPFQEIGKALGNIKRSGSRYLLTTSFTDRDSNTDIEIGDWRPLNLQEAPFNLGTPERTINENHPEARFGDKSLCLWRISELPSRF